MDIDSEPGSKVRYTNTGGYDHDRRSANEVLKEGEVYTVGRIEVGNWSSYVELEEVSGKSFNTVMFDSYPDGVCTRCGEANDLRMADCRRADCPRPEGTVGMVRLDNEFNEWKAIAHKLMPFVRDSLTLLDDLDEDDKSAAEEVLAEFKALKDKYGE
jgi:hypothetical protein